MTLISFHVFQERRLQGTLDLASCGCQQAVTHPLRRRWRRATAWIRETPRLPRSYFRACGHFVSADRADASEAPLYSEPGHGAHPAACNPKAEVVRSRAGCTRELHVLAGLAVSLADAGRGAGVLDAGLRSPAGMSRNGTPDRHPSSSKPGTGSAGHLRDKRLRIRLLLFRGLTPLGAGFDSRRLHHFPQGTPEVWESLISSVRPRRVGSDESPTVIRWRGRMIRPAQIPGRPADRDAVLRATGPRRALLETRRERALADGRPDAAARPARAPERARREDQRRVGIEPAELACTRGLRG